MDSNSLVILKNRYFQKDENGNIIETLDDFYNRVATAVAGDKKYLIEKFKEEMKEGRFLPNSPTLVNAGVGDGNCLSACFTVSPKDDLESIFDTLKHAGLIVKSGGGVGFGLGMLRPKGDAIKTVHKKALGVIKVLKNYSSFLRDLTAGGSFREAALMAQLPISHPEIRDFIHVKDNFDELKNFNISVQITDSFMFAVQNNKNWNLINPRDGAIIETVNAKDLWDEICVSAHKTGDPGLCFYSRVEETHPNSNLGAIHTSNPCGEELLEDFGSCNLGSINLSKFVVDDYKGLRGKSVDWRQLRYTIENAVKFLNCVIDVNTFPFEELKNMNRTTRRIGLGVMGWHDMLVKLGIKYDTEEALLIADLLSHFINDCAWNTSESLAEVEGVFPNYDDSMIPNWHNSKNMRNSSVTTIAPTGTISRIANCSFGIEPYFGLVWESNVLWDDDNYVKLIDCPAPIRENIIACNNGAMGITVEDFLQELKEKANDREYQAKMLKEIGLDIDLFPIASEISPEYHVKMQAAFQKNVTNAVSKTVNMPNSATVQDVNDIYFQAWRLGCKGITMYREGSREVEVLSKGNSYFVPDKKESNDRGRTLYGKTEKVSTGHGNMYVTMNSNDEGELYEVITNMGKSGACNNASLEIVSRLISLALQWDIPVDEITKQLYNITCCPQWSDGSLMRSPYDALARVINKEYGMNNHNDDKKADESLNVDKIRNICHCGGEKISQGGCNVCLLCGDSKCG